MNQIEENKNKTENKTTKQQASRFECEFRATRLSKKQEIT